MTLKLILMQGLPASGKSTMAEKISKTLDIKRINRDLLREMLNFGIYSQSSEGEIVLAELNLARICLHLGYSVVIDDTNLKDSTIDMWKNFSEEEDVEFKIIAMDTDVKECVRRDSLRGKPVGEDAIMSMNVHTKSMCKRISNLNYEYVKSKNTD